MPHADSEARKAYRRAYGKRPEVAAKRRADQRQVRRLRVRTDETRAAEREYNRLRYRRRAAAKKACAPTKEWRAPVSAGPTLRVKLRKLEAMGLDWHNLPRIAAAKFCAGRRPSDSTFDDLTQAAAEAMIVALVRNRFDKEYARAQWAAYLLRAAKCRFIDGAESLRRMPEGHIDDSTAARRLVQTTPWEDRA